MSYPRHMAKAKDRSSQEAARIQARGQITGALVTGTALVIAAIIGLWVGTSNGVVAVGKDAIPATATVTTTYPGPTVTQTVTANETAPPAGANGAAATSGVRRTTGPSGIELNAGSSIDPLNLTSPNWDVSVYSFGGLSYSGGDRDNLRVGGQHAKVSDASANSCAERTGWETGEFTAEPDTTYCLELHSGSDTHYAGLHILEAKNDYVRFTLTVWDKSE